MKPPRVFDRLRNPCGSVRACRNSEEDVMNYTDLPLYSSVVGKKDFTGWARSTSTDPEFSYWMINGAWQFTVIRKFGEYQLFLKGDHTDPIEGVNTFDEALQVALTMWRMS